MPIIDSARARRHLREDDDFPEEQFLPYLRGAEIAAQQFLNRRVYGTQEELDAALATVTPALVTARAAYDAAVLAADDIDDTAARCEARTYAHQVYMRAQFDAREIRDGIVANEDIVNGILFIFGHRFENRQDVQSGVTASAVPHASEFTLFPYRVGLGI